MAGAGVLDPSQDGGQQPLARLAPRARVVEPVSRTGWGINHCAPSGPREPVPEPGPHVAATHSRRRQARGREIGRRGPRRGLLTLWSDEPAVPEAAAQTESAIGL